MREELSDEIKQQLQYFGRHPVAAGLIWHDETSYSRGRERVPTIFSAYLKSVRVTIVRGHIRYPGEWIYICRDLGIDNQSLGSVETPEGAAITATELCRQRANAIASLFNALEPDTVTLT